MTDTSHTLTAEVADTDQTAIWTEQFDAELLPQRDEPEWLTQLRRQAWEIWLDMPVPPPPQRNLRKLPDLSLTALAPADCVDQASAELAERIHSWGEADGAFLEVNGCALTQELAESLAAKGVILCSLSDAVVQHGELVKAHLASIYPAISGKELALNLAYWKGGYFVYVPRNVQLELPVYTLQALQGEAQVLFQRSLIVVEPNAKLTLIHDCHSANVQIDQAGSLVSDVLELVIGDNAEVNAVYLQQWGRDVHCQAYSQARLGRSARYTALNIATGARYHAVHTGVTLDAPGAETKLLGLFVGDSEQHFRQTSLQNHVSPHTVSHLQYHTVLRDKAYSFYNGMIAVTQQAQQTESNQLSKSLLLSETARADAIPNLEILADDVQSGHGAAIGSLDPDQLFYLQSRGFEKSTAENLLVEGFMEEVILQFPHVALQPAIKEHLAMYLLAQADEREDERDDEAEGN